jgi:hypothetical protein
VSLGRREKKKRIRKARSRVGEEGEEGGEEYLL